MARSHRELVVWRKSMDLAEDVHRLIRRFPADERYRLSDQIARAVVSVPANIAEGCGRGSDRDFARFLSIAKGSVVETETLLILATRVGYLRDDELSALSERTSEISKMLTSLRRHLRKTSA
ncbi:MAG: four helix bundle protein [Gemmatimonadota bacterium]